MSHQILSRKYRPQRFEDLVGQDHVARILENAVASDRVGHAYLFVGPRGVGKTSSARIFARILNCAEREDGGDTAACGRCPSCIDITAGTDLDVVEMDAASNNHVEDVRRLREQVGYATVRSRFRIWIVDEVHMLSVPAFNAFLKTLEEPPEGVKFIFCTTEEHKLPDTFRSRCQRIEFRPVGEPAMADRLEALAKREGFALEAGLARAIADTAKGGLRDAESLLEQLIAACPEGQITLKDLDQLAGRAPAALLATLVEAVAAGEPGAALDAVDACLETGAKPAVLLEQWMEVHRRALGRAARREEGAPSLPRTAHAIDLLLEKRAHLRAGADGVLVCQVAAVESAQLPDARDLDALLEAVRRMPEGSAPPAPTPPAPSSGTPPARASGRRGGSDAPDRRASRAAETPGAETSGAETRGPETSGVETRGAETGGSGGGGRTPRGMGTSGRGASEPSLETVRDVWETLTEHAGSQDGRLAEALARTQPARVKDGSVVVRVPPGPGLVRSALERRGAVLAFRRATEKVLGRPLALATEVDESAAPPPVPPPSSADENETVRLVTERTGGRLLGLESRPDQEATS